MEDFEVSLEEIETPEVVEEIIQPEVEVVEATSDPLAQSVYEQLLEKGYVDEDDEPFDGSFEYIDNKLSQLPQKLLASAIQELPTESQQLLKFVAAAGKELTREELREYFQTYLAEADDIKFDTQDDARKFLETELKSKGLRDSAIRAQLDELEDEELLIEEAEKLRKEKIKKTDTLLSNKQQSISQKAEQQRIFISNLQKEIEETKWAKSKQDKVRETIPKANEILNKIVADPKAYVQFIDILTRFDGKQFNFEDLRKQGEARAASTLKSKIEKNGFSSAGTTSASSENKLLDMLKDYEIVV